MKARRFDQILKARGYKRRVYDNNEDKTVIFIKTHKYVTVMCVVDKDTHKKGKTMTFTVTSQISSKPEIQKEIDFDRDYLVKEAVAIGNAFDKLRQMKKPKYLYCNL